MADTVVTLIPAYTLEIVFEYNTILLGIPLERGFPELSNIKRFTGPVAANPEPARVELPMNMSPCSTCKLAWMAVGVGPTTTSLVAITLVVVTVLEIIRLEKGWEIFAEFTLEIVLPKIRVDEIGPSRLDEFRLEIPNPFPNIFPVEIEFETKRLPVTCKLALGVVVPTPTRLLVDIKRFEVETDPPAPSKVTKFPCIPDGAEPEGPCGPWGPAGPVGPVGPGGPCGPRMIF